MQQETCFAYISQSKCKRILLEVMDEATEIEWAESDENSLHLKFI